VTAGFALKGAGLKTGAYNDGGAAAVIGRGATFVKQVDSMGVGEGILGLSLCAVGERIRARGWARGGREPGRNWAPAMGRRKRPPQKAAATKGVECDSHGTWWHGNDYLSSIIIYWYRSNETDSAEGKDEGLKAEITKGWAEDSGISEMRWTYLVRLGMMRRDDCSGIA
jgi:hypothetical protein